MTAKVVIYSTSYCFYCRAAERFLDAKGVEYTPIDITGDHDKRIWLAEVSGQMTVPQIFVNDQPIGGFTDMQALDRQGKLEELLA